jgi:hypothetical protein
MGMEELETEWNAHDLTAKYQDWDDTRVEAAPLYKAALDEFLAGGELDTFRSKIDSLGKSQGWWGFRGTGQMFFNQLVKAAEPEDLTETLRLSLSAPASPAEAQHKLEALVAAVHRARDRAQVIGATKPGPGRVNFFVSFFWELADREAWPIFFPNSRDVLEQHGLLDVSGPHPQLYLTYRDVVLELKQRLGTGTWGVEHLLWYLGKGKSEPPEPEPPVVDPQPDGGVYAHYRADDLHFPDEVVTSLVLSLTTKRFVILSGISGTGKTQIALGLARYLESLAAGEDPLQEIEAPTPTSDDAYLRLTAPKLQRAGGSLDAPIRAVIENKLGLPERGANRRYKVRLPDGTVSTVRLNNLGFADPSRQLYVLSMRKLKAWLDEHARPGDFLRMHMLGETENADMSLSVVHGQPVEAADTQSRFQLVAVRADWTDPRGLLGYYNPLTGTYIRTVVVDLLLAAAEDPDRPYLIVLDEMNLARVEYYFSDFLSGLESGAPIELMAAGVEEELLTSGQEDVPASLVIPPNVAFVGTVNVDETTHAFSPKVLDRANVIEFNDVDVERALGHPVDEEHEGLRLSAAVVDPAWLCGERGVALSIKTLAHEQESFTEALEDVHDILSRHHLHFGYRVIDEVSAFVGHALEKCDGDAETVVRRAFDLQLLQKVLPKFSGGRELEAPLGALLAYVLDASKNKDVDVDAVKAKARDGGNVIRYPQAARKLLRMLDRLDATGFVSALE